MGKVKTYAEVTEGTEKARREKQIQNPPESDWLDRHFPL